MAYDTDATAGDTRHIFDFFGLPRELRDEIHDLALEDREELLLSCDLAVKATNTAATNLLLVSKDYSSEYQQRAAKKILVTITDTPDWGSDEPVAVPQLALKTSSFKANILVGNEDELEAHERWICNFVAKARRLSSLSIRMNYRLEDEGNTFSTLRDELNEGLWVEWKALVDLKVHNREVGEGFNFDCSEGLRLQWSKETGKVEEVTKQMGSEQTSD